MQPDALKITLTEDFGSIPEDFMIECCESEGMPLLELPFNLRQIFLWVCAVSAIIRTARFYSKNRGNDV